MPEPSIQATWHEPVQAGRHFKNVIAPWCKSMWAAGHRLHVEVRLYEDAKTDRQRAYYHGVVLKTIAQQARPNGTQFPLAVWKEHFRKEYLTEDLGVKGYSQLIDRVSAFAATELGVSFPASFDQWERMQVDPDTGEIIGGVLE